MENICLGMQSPPDNIPPARPAPADGIRFAVGYQLADPDEESFAGIVQDYRPAIEEIYFPWADLPSGRAALTRRRGYTDWSGQQRMEEDLQACREMGVRLDLLLNANCYGGRAVSRCLERQVCSILEHLADIVNGADAVTTASPAVAHIVKKHFPAIETRASVNMQIGTVNGMEYAAQLFDSFYVRRECNRDLAHLARLKEWADGAGKRLHLLANSGCLDHCPGQIFHDNMVAHEQELDETANMEGWTPHICWNYLRQPDRRHVLLQANWIRPEDLRHYAGLFRTVKLATRMHAQPRLVIHAYAGGRHDGNLLNLFEPGFARALAPAMLDNRRFPADWFERTSTCGHRCHQCDYCRRVFQAILVQPPADAL